MSRSAGKVVATLLGCALAFPLFMGLGKELHLNTDPGALIAAGVVLLIAMVAGR